MDPIRYNYNKCSEQIFRQFIDSLNKSGLFVLRSHHPSDDSVLQDRFTFTNRGRRVSLVYETKAQTLVVTAPSDVMNDVVAALPTDALELKLEKHREIQKPEKQSDKPKPPEKQVKQDKTKPPEKQAKPDKTKPPEKQVKPDKPKPPEKQVKTDKTKPPEKQSKPDKTKQPEKQVKSDKPKQPEKQSKPDKTKQPEKQVKQDKTKPPEKQSDKPKQREKQVKTDKPKPPEKQAKTDKPKQPEKQTKQGEKKGNKGKQDGKNVFTVNKIDAERCKEFLKKIKANKAMRYKTSVDEVDGSKTYSVTSQGNKATVRYAGGTMQLSGMPSDLYSELQLMLSSLSDYKTAIDTHIKYVGEEKRSSAVERQLRRKLPAAFEFLSEQSKIDLAIGIIDINNSAVVLSDYSTLLIPCFRGLERLIFDLQRAQNISVKMIGQAYEKEGGEYVLKAGYRRKIPSVVYAEVMASLYGEYVKHRNFYAHSDNMGNVSRVISDKSVVQGIFNHIMDVINYNGKKLREIGFRIQQNT